MRTVRFGRTGVDVPGVSLGTWAHGGPNMAGSDPVGWTGHDKQLARRALLETYAAGITHWDTADVYGDGRAEQLIGSVWSEVPRDRIFLASKVGWDPGPFEHFYHPEQVRRQLERSLTNLSVECIDLYYLHHCDFGPRAEYLDGAIEMLHRFRDEGKIRFLGLSDWDSGLVLRYADRVDPDAIQIYRNVVDDQFRSTGLNAWAAAHDVGVVFFSPLKQGLLLGKYDRPPDFGEGDFRNQVDEFRDPAFLRRMRRCRDALTERFADHPQPVLHGLLGSLLADTENACVLVGMRNPDQVRAAAAAADVLRDEDAAWVWEQYAG